MKARVVGASPCVLAYCLPAGEPAGDAVCAAMASCRLPVRHIGRDRADCLVGDLADGRAAPAGAAGPCVPAVLFSGLSRGQLDAALAALRAAGSPVALKAVVTPTSRTWTVRALLEHLQREHAQLHGGGDK